MAQNINPSWYVQPSVNGFRPDDNYGIDQTEWGVGIKVGKPLHPMWDVQMGLTHARADQGAADLRQSLLGADALLMMSRQRFRPFLLAGGGVLHDRFIAPLGRISRGAPYFNAGIGFQLDLTERWSMQADLRAVRANLRDEARFGFNHSTNKYLTVGLNYALSPPMAPPPPPRPVEPPPPAVTPPPPPPPPPPPARFEKVTLSATELFAFNSATLTMPQPRLDEIAAALTADPSITDVDITGYADRLGSEAYNQKLSEERAMAVRDYLTGKGIAPERLKAYGKGESNPVVTCTNPKRDELIKCLEPNRRVEVEQITIERRVQ